MRLGGRLQGAIEVLEDIEANNRAAADALRDWGKAHRFAGAGDRAVIGNIVYDALRRKASIGWRMNSNTAQALAFGALMQDGEMSAEEIAAALDGDKFAPAPLGQDLLAAWQSRDLSDAPDHVRADIAPWCEAGLKEQFGDDWVAQAAALATRPPVDLRVNSLKTTPQELVEALSASGAQISPLLEQALRIAPLKALGRHPNLQNDTSFADGWFEVQDTGSQIAALMTGAKPGNQVLDYCAGAGGKTLALAAMMQNKGQIHAFDLERARLAPMNERLQRAGVRNAQVYNKIEGLAQLEGLMDIVLVDAPCTGAGTWRRRPDAKWRLTPQQLETREADQREVLEAGKKYVKEGGRLVYVTCSLLASENHQQIAAFLQRNPEYSTVDARTLWDEVVKPDGEHKPVFPQYGAILSPLSTDTDGFYIAVLQKQ